MTYPTRREVFEALAAASDADDERTTTVEALAARLDADAHLIEDHIDALGDCALALRRPDGRVRVTITGEEFLALDPDDLAIVDPSGGAES